LRQPRLANANEAAIVIAKAPTVRATRENGTKAVALGFRAGRSGGVIVGVAIDGRVPHVVLSAVLATAAEGDRLSLEPYRVVSEMARCRQGEAPAEAAAAVAEGRNRQGALAAKGLADIIRQLRQARCEPVVAALLINRAGWITDTLAYSLSWPEHVPVAEGLAVRDAFRFACDRCDINVVEIDEKSLHEVASEQLRLSLRDIETRLKSLGVTVGRPWRKEQKLACLAAWVALPTVRSGMLSARIDP
jgi:hypothetical protein